MDKKEKEIIKKPLERKLKQFNTAPFLFVGSGMSQRYLGLENWENLLIKFCHTGKDFNYYSTLTNGENEQIAEHIAEDFHEIWWTKDKFQKHREEFGDTLYTKHDPFKLEISKYIQKESIDFEIPEVYQEEIEALKKSTIDGIITTNYDLFLEKIFPEFEVFIGQDDMIFSNRQSIGEIYKIHGCCTNPSSLILTQSDYDRFREVNKYLASVLLEIFLEHPVFFVGYSMSDTNIHRILNNISNCLGNENLDQLSERLYFVNWIGKEADNISIQKSIQLVKGLKIPITVINTSSYTPIFESFKNIKRKIPVRTLRICKEHFYELIKTNDPENQLFVSDIDEANSEDIEFAIGVGTIKKMSELGYKEIKRKKLFRDITFDDQKFDPDKLLSNTIPNKLKRSKYIPFFKYLNEVDIISDQEYVESPYDLEKGMNLTKRNFAPGKVAYNKYKDELENKTVNAIIKKYGKEDAAFIIPMLPNSQIVLTELENYIKSNFELIDHNKTNINLGFRKCIVLFDQLNYGW